jgi:hypothetical protein
MSCCLHPVPSFGDAVEPVLARGPIRMLRSIVIGIIEKWATMDNGEV